MSYAEFIADADEIHETKLVSFVASTQEPWHRAMALLLLQGKSDGELAQVFGTTVSYVESLKTQPWFADLVAQVAQEHSQEDLGNLFHNAATGAILQLQTLAATAEKESVRVSAASKLLDAYFKHAPERQWREMLEADQELEIIEREIRALRA